jgi:hypothetical protein
MDESTSGAATQGEPVRVKKQPMDKRPRLARAPSIIASSSLPSSAYRTAMMLDAELNDFGAQLAMLGGHAADRDG